MKKTIALTHALMLATTCLTSFSSVCFARAPIRETKTCTTTRGLGPQNMLIRVSSVDRSAGGIDFKVDMTRTVNGQKFTSPVAKESDLSSIPLKIKILADAVYNEFGSYGILNFSDAQALIPTKYLNQPVVKVSQATLKMDDGKTYKLTCVTESGSEIE